MTHRIHFRDVGSNMTDRLEPEYAAEIDRMTESREAAYAAAQRRVEAAERKAQRLESRLASATGKTKRMTKKELSVAWAMVELRRQELMEFAGLMTHTPAAAKNRGDKSWRPVPARHGGDF